MFNELLEFARKIRHQPMSVRYHNYIQWLAIWYPEKLAIYLWKQAKKNSLCLYCGAHVKNWQEVFGEVHKCYTE